MKKESKKKIKQTILKRIYFMLGLNIPTRMVIQAVEEDVAHTLEVMVEVVVEDVVRATRKTKCYHYDQYRHFVLKCPERNQNQKVNLNETQEKCMYHEEVDANERYRTKISDESRIVNFRNEDEIHRSELIYDFELMKKIKAILSLVVVVVPLPNLSFENMKLFMTFDRESGIIRVERIPFGFDEIVKTISQEP
ncbi:hypothetical protein Tco_0763533 [Tanacetum coccineum]